MLELAEQGEQKDRIKGFCGEVTQWKKFRFEIYELTEQVKQQIELAEEFAVSGENHYYSRLIRIDLRSGTNS